MNRVKVQVVAGSLTRSQLQHIAQVADVLLVQPRRLLDMGFGRRLHDLNVLDLRDLVSVVAMKAPAAQVQQWHLRAEHGPDGRTFPSMQYRTSQMNLSAQYASAAKWSSGAHNAGHRSHENRHAERQRNAAAYKPLF